MITLSIDVTLLDKQRFNEAVRKNGKKAIFCNLVMFESEGQYGDFIVKQSVKKEEGKVEMPILGNAKVWSRRDGGPSAKHTAPAESDASPIGEDDVPF